MKRATALGLVAGGLLWLTGCQPDAPAEPPLFTRLDSAQTGVRFVNGLQETAQLNFLDYLYFYNGGGVAAGDLNGDGRVDLYFVSNQGPNRLYLNETGRSGSPPVGPLRFRDVTTAANVVGQADWQTGVTLADVNADGRLDIYVCAVGKFRGLRGRNELYINQGNTATGVPQFREMAAQYGLAFSGFSTQAAFFDYDHDGDLDCFLLNHAVHTAQRFDPVADRYLRHPEAGDYLFRNEGGRFTDVSAQAGIYQAPMGYGLGVSVADLNGDGWEDLYVSNDFHEDDYYYVNQRNGTFRERARQAFGHTSRFSMGNDVADIDNDGRPDVVTLDMYPDDETVEKSSTGEDPLDIYQYKLAYGYMNQYSRNCLQRNVDGERFSEIGAQAGLAATDWSWAALLADYDLDGRKDLFVTNGIARRPNNLDYTKYIANDSVQRALGTDPTAFRKATRLMPEGRVPNYLFQGGEARLHFVDKSAAWGFAEPTLSNGAAYADLDNDGDLDLVTNNIDAPAGIYQNNATQLHPGRHYLKIRLLGNGGNRFGVGATVRIRTKTGLQVQQLMPTRGFQSAVEPVLLFGLGSAAVIDSLTVIWPDGQGETRRNVRPNQTLTLRQTDATAGNVVEPRGNRVKPLLTELPDTTWLPYRHRENTSFLDFSREPLMPFKVSTEGPALAVGDINGDGLDDIYAGGARRQAGSLLLGQPDGQFTTLPQPAFRADSTFEDVDALFFDADGDRDLDLYVVSGGNEFYGRMTEQFDRLYRNDGLRGSGRRGDGPRGHGRVHFSRDATALPPMPDNKSCVRPADVDADGDLDLFVGGRVVGFAYGKTPRSYLLVNDGRGHFADATDQLAPALRQAGMVTDAVWADVDGDKDADLLVVGHWMAPRLFLNQAGRLTEVEKPFLTNTPMRGLWQSLAVADVDQDGDADVVAGNWGLNTKFRKGSTTLLTMWTGDLDNNDRTDQILAYTRPGTDAWYPVAFRDELGKQLPSLINRRFTDYVSFAGKTIDQLFPNGELAQTEQRTVDQWASVYLENHNGRFRVHALPPLAQVSPLFALLPTDLDADGDLDVVAGGNFWGASTYQGRYDASYGLVLRNDGRRGSGPRGSGRRGGFTVLSPAQSGWVLTGEVRAIRAVRTTTGLHYVVGRNNVRAQVFRPTTLPKNRPTKP